MTTDFAVREVEEQDWVRLRALRLEMLADTPIAYLETLEAAERHPVRHWRTRARGGANRIELVAETPEGRWLGTMACTAAGSSQPMLVGVYVAPDARGTRAGVTDALLGAIEHWAAARGDLLLLEVNELNPRAIAAYEHRGFVRTGRTSPYPLEPPSLELEMAKPLA